MKNSALRWAILACLLLPLHGCLTNSKNKGTGTVSRGYFVIQFPTTGAILKKDTSYNVQWVSLPSGTASILNLALYKKDSLVQIIANGTANDGLQPWVISGAVVPGDSFRLKLSSPTDTAQYDYSGFFSIISGLSGTIQVTVPSSGSSIAIGSAMDIRWTTTGSVGSAVKIDLYKGTTFIRTIITTSNSGSYSWNNVTTTGGTGNDYNLVIASSADPSISGKSSNFTITTQYNGGYTITSPPAKTKWNKGTSYNITWTTTGTPGTSTSIRLLRADSLVQTLSTVSTSAGTYAWNVSTALEPDSNYAIEMASIQDPSIMAKSARFTIQSQYNGGFTITSPPAGVKWNTGTSYNITWTSTGTPGTSVILRLYKDTTLNLTIRSIATNNGTFSWLVPGTLTGGSDYTIEILSYQDNSIKARSQKFTVEGVRVDSYEPDSSRDIAKSLDNGVTQQRTITYQDEDYIKFTADSGDIAIFLDSGLNVYKTVYFEQESNAKQTFSYTSKNNVFIAPDSGTYFLQIRGWTSSAMGEYTFMGTLRKPNNQQIFTSPTDSSVWSVGTTYTITWAQDSILFPSTVTLYLFQGATQVRTITSISHATGTYSWTIPTLTTYDSTYRIRMQNSSNSQIAVFSPYFRINSQYSGGYTITSPPADVKWDKGTRYNITWTTTGNPGTSASIRLLRANSLVLTLTSVTTSTGTYAWTIPTTIDPDSTYAIEIVSIQDPTIKSKSNVFTIVSPYNGGFTITSPTATSKWAAGTSYNITWTSNGNPGTNAIIRLYKDSTPTLTITGAAVNNGTYAWTVPGNLTTDSTYSIEILSYQDNSIKSRSPSFLIQGLTPDIYEPDSTRDLATDLQDGVKQQRSITLLDHDYIKFTADSGDIAIFVDSGLNVYKTVYFGQETLARQTYSYTSKTNMFVAPTSGIYYLQIRGWTTSISGTGGYTFLGALRKANTTQIFTSPLNASVWNVGTAYNITWTQDAQLFPSTVTLYLFQGTTQVRTITSISHATGTYSWTVPVGTVSGSTYRIQMRNTSNSQIFLYSPNFTIN